MVHIRRKAAVQKRRKTTKITKKNTSTAMQRQGECVFLLLVSLTFLVFFLLFFLPLPCKGIKVYKTFMLLIRCCHHLPCLRLAICKMMTNWCSKG